MEMAAILKWVDHINLKNWCATNLGSPVFKATHLYLRKTYLNSLHAPSKVECVRACVRACVRGRKTA